MEFLYKCIRAVVFPFRFLYLECYRRRVLNQRNAYLRKAAEKARAGTEPDGAAPSREGDGTTGI